MDITRIDYDGEYEVISIGVGKPYANFFVGVHGDEIAPICGAELLIQSLEGQKLHKSFRIIIANKKAVEKKTRYIESDLNRSFPGKPSGLYEEKLAGKLMQFTKVAKYNFDFHACDFNVEQYSVINVYRGLSKKILESVGVSNCVFMNSDSLIKYANNGIAFEMGIKDGEETAQRTLNLMKLILSYLKIISPSGLSFKKAKLSTYLVYRQISKKGYEFSQSKVIDFKLVKKGAVIAKSKEGQLLVAEDNFYPIWVNDKYAIRAAKRIKFLEDK